MKYAGQCVHSELLYQSCTYETTEYGDGASGIDIRLQGMKAVSQAIRHDMSRRVTRKQSPRVIVGAWAK